MGVQKQKAGEMSEKDLSKVSGGASQKPTQKPTLAPAADPLKKSTPTPPKK